MIPADLVHNVSQGIAKVSLNFVSALCKSLFERANNGVHYVSLYITAFQKQR